MLRINKLNRESILEKIYQGKIDYATLSTSGFVDDIILSMHENGILDCVKSGFKDKRADNTTVPFDFVLTMSVAAKMRVHSSLTDISTALTNHEIICSLGYSMWDENKNLKKSLTSESNLRHLIGKYSSTDFLNSYIDTAQNYIIPRMNLVPTIHILDCTKIEVNFNNKNYESADIGIDSDGKKARGYKLATLRGITKDTGVIEDVRFGKISIHDLELSREMVKTSPILKRGDILINDRCFLSRDIMNYLKSRRGVDV